MIFYARASKLAARGSSRPWPTLKIQISRGGGGSGPGGFLFSRGGKRTQTPLINQESGGGESSPPNANKFLISRFGCAVSCGSAKRCGLSGCSRAWGKNQRVLLLDEHVMRHAYFENTCATQFARPNHLAHRSASAAKSGQRSLASCQQASSGPQHQWPATRGLTNL